MSTYTRLNLGELKKTVVFRPEKNSPTLLRYKKREKKFALFLQETMTFYYQASMKNMWILCLESSGIQVTLKSHN